MKFSVAISNCKAKIKDGQLAVKIISSKDNGGIYLVSLNKKEKSESMAAVGLGCEDCHKKEPLDDLKKNASLIIKKTECTYPKTIKNGLCMRQCPDNEVFIYPGECTNCRETCVDCEEYFLKVVTRQNFNDLPKRPFRIDLEKEACVDAYGCKISDEIYKGGSCIKNCKNGATFEEEFGCTMSIKTCEFIKNRLLKKPYEAPPHWVQQLKVMGCDTESLLAQYVEDFEMAVEEIYDYCISTPHLTQVDSQFSYVSKGGLGKPLLKECATQIGIPSKELEGKIQYFTKFSNYPREMIINLHE